MGSRFEAVEQGPPIEVFALNKMFAEDNFKNKVSLGVGGMYFMMIINKYEVIVITGILHNPYFCI